MAERLGVDLKDAITFDVQGVSIKTYIGSIRDVDWQRIQTNFIFVFPLGVLEEAPQFHVMMAKIRDKEKSTGFQRQLIARFPNVSVIDLTLILKTVDDFMGKVAMVIQFMALFSISTGMVVLAGAVINSKYLRLKENVLLRTLGALRRQIVKMTLIEYAYLGLFAGLTGVILSLLAGWGLTIFFFDVVFFPDLLGLSQIWIGITMLTMLVGWVNTRGIFDRSPLEVLRKEV
jgi:putative ABC transport system permease protein